MKDEINRNIFNSSSEIRLNSKNDARYCHYVEEYSNLCYSLVKPSFFKSATLHCAHDTSENHFPFTGLKKIQIKTGNANSSLSKMCLLFILYRHMTLNKNNDIEKKPLNGISQAISKMLNVCLLFECGMFDAECIQSQNLYI